MRVPMLAGVLATLLVAAPASAASLTTRTGHVMEVDEATGELRLKNRHGKTIWRTAPETAGEWAIAAAADLPTSHHLFATFRFQEPRAPWVGAHGRPTVTTEPESFTLTYPSGFRVTADAARGTGLSVRMHPPTNRTWDRFAARFVLDPGEAIFGLGSRTHGSNQRGSRLTNWVEEGGNGKSERPLFGVSNYPTASHAPVPFYMSSQGYGLAINVSNRIVWDIGKQHPHRLEVRADVPWLGLEFFLGDTPAQILKAYSERNGRPSMPPLWAMAPTEWGKGGSEAVRAKAEFLRRERIPTGAIWYEDWVGLEHGPLPRLTHLPWGRWIHDPAHYPDPAGLNAGLERAGFKSLGYFNPFVMKDGPHTGELLAIDGVLKDEQKRPLWWLGPFGWLSQLDLTNPKVVAWAHRRLDAFEKLGFDGAMIDFGEWTPYEAEFTSGSTGETEHNRYPVRWAELHRSFWELRRPYDHVIYNRSGYAGIASRSTYMWAGDQNTDWGADDGFPTALTAILSAGLSGIPLMTHDVGGFANLGGPGRTKELYFRWVSLGAFSTIMRSHSGQKPALNWTLDSDAETIAHHRKMAEAHMDLAFYRFAACREAEESGMPVMRHLYLAFPEDRVCRGIEDQYMLGGDLMVAPVLTPGTERRRVYLPAGRWYGYWDGGAFEGGRWHEVSAAVGEIPVFVRAGAIVPLLPKGIQTLSKADGVPGVEAALSGLRVRVYPGGPGRMVFAEGMVIESQPARGLPGRKVARTAVVPGRVSRVRVGAWDVTIQGAKREIPRVEVEWMGEVEGVSL